MMAKVSIPDDNKAFRIAEEYVKSWDKNDYCFNDNQLKYMNGVVMQELMKLLPDYSEQHKRKIYEYVIAQLADYAVHEYWRIRQNDRGN